MLLGLHHHSKSGLEGGLGLGIYLALNYASESGPQKISGKDCKGHGRPVLIPYHGYDRYMSCKVDCSAIGKRDLHSQESSVLLNW